MKKLELLRKLPKAFETYYNENQDIDQNLIERLNSYVENLDSISAYEYEELENFVALNQIEIKHIANIYLDKKDKQTLKKRLKWMMPSALAQNKFKVIKGNIQTLTDAMSRKDSIKILKKEYKAN